MYTPEQEREFTILSKQYLEEKPDKPPQDVVDDLRQMINYHEWRYYVKNDPVVSDFEYDMLYKQLQALEEENPDLVVPDSPTQRVSSDLAIEFESVPHLVPMLSLDNSYSSEDLRKFDDQVKKLTGKKDVEYVVEPKFDGGSLAVIYENDNLARAATRGDGIVGEEITANARTIRTLPLKAKFSKFGITKAELRGEAIIRKDIFAKINREREEEGLTLLANPRNSAAGALRTKDPAETARRKLDSILYQISYAIDNNGKDMLASWENHSQSLDRLDELGFRVSHEERKVCTYIDEVIDFCREWEEKREDYPYEIDGMVIKLNDYKLQEKCGSTSHHPRWAIAFKFKAKQATTTLQSVEYQVGKIGSVTPVAKVQPVQLAGVMISSISLHNEDFIKSKDIRIGDTVLVERAGDVIPYIVKSLPDLRQGDEKKIEFPERCPVCDTELVRPEDEAAWRCPNYQCKAQVLQRLIFHVSKNAMDIDGFGAKNVERFHELGWLDNLANVYRLDYNEIAGLEGFGGKSAEKLKRSVEQAKNNPIHRLLHSLSIHHLGKRASKLLAERIGHVLELENWEKEDYLEIPDIGPVVADNVSAFFHVPDNINMLKEMETLGVNLTQTGKDKPVKVSEDAVFAGKTILFTGSLQSLTRKEAQTMAEQVGAKNISAVSSNLDILVVGENAGSKLTKAKETGTVTIMTEDEFLELVGQG